jgi:hypothetical protein
LNNILCFGKILIAVKNFHQQWIEKLIVPSATAVKEEKDHNRVLISGMYKK